MKELDNQVENDNDYDLLSIDTESMDDTAEVEEVEIDEEQDVELGDESEPTEEPVEEVKVDEETPVELLEDLEVKFLHDVKKLKDIPKEELKTLVQKGMNHDRLVEKVEGYKALETKLSEFDEIATLHGMTADELRESILNSYFENKAFEEGITPELLKREYNQGKKERSDKAAVKKQVDEESAMSRFIDKYPMVKANEINAETWELIKDGMDITIAYEKQIDKNEKAALLAKVAELEGKLKTNTQNAEVKKKAVVKSTTTNGSIDPDKNDDFLQGLFGK